MKRPIEIEQTPEPCKSGGNDVPTTCEGHSGAFNSVWSDKERQAFLQLFPRGKQVGTLQTLPSR